MKKIIFVDGSQGVGKSTLIDGICSKFPIYKYKFPFSEYTKTFNLTDRNSLKGFQLGKDLASLYFLSREGISSKYSQIIDRGPLSSVYYSLTTGRMSIDEVEEFFKIISEYSDKFSFILVVSNTPVEFIRDKKDGFDELKSKEVDPEGALEIIVNLANKYGVRVKVFRNNFSESIENNSYRFYKLVKEEL